MIWIILAFLGVPLWLSGVDRTIEVASAGSQKDAVLGPFKTERVLGGPNTVGPMDTAPARA